VWCVCGVWPMCVVGGVCMCVVCGMYVCGVYVVCVCVCVCVCDGKRLSPPQKCNTGQTWFLSFNSML